MAEKKKPARKATVVSPSRRGEGSRPKPVAKRVSPSARGEGSTNLKATVAMKKKQAKVQEAGVANVAGTVAKGAIAIGKRIASQSPKAKSAAKITKDTKIQKARSDYASKMEKQKNIMLEAERRKKIYDGSTRGNTGRANIDYIKEKARYEAMREIWKSNYSK